MMDLDQSNVAHLNLNQGQGQDQDGHQSVSKKTCATDSTQGEVGLDMSSSDESNHFQDEKFIATIKIETVNSMLTENHGKHIGSKIKIVVTFLRMTDRTAVLKQLMKMEVSNGIEKERDMKIMELTFDADSGVNLLDNFVMSLMLLYPLPPSVFPLSSSS